MAINKEDIKELSNDELFEKAASEKLRLKKMKFNHTITSIDNPMKIRETRRDIARLLTELRKRELASDNSELTENK